jgi:hypothetical protein
MYNNGTQLNGFYPTYYPAATAPMMRPETAPYMMPQVAPAAVIKGRPVSSFEEARVAQVDLDGSVSFFPDLGNKKIYTKRINADGTAAIHTYSLDICTPELTPEYVTRDEITELKQTLDEIINKLKVSVATAPTQQQKLNF